MDASSICWARALQVTGFLTSTSDGRALARVQHEKPGSRVVEASALVVKGCCCQREGPMLLLPAYTWCTCPLLLSKLQGPWAGQHAVGAHLNIR